MLNVINGVNGGVAGSNETNDVLIGGAENNTFFVGRGVDVVDGGAGQDVLNVDGEAIEWNITRIDANTIVMTHPTWGENTLTNVESIFFARSGVTLTVDEAIEQVGNLPGQRVDSDNVLNGTNGDDLLLFRDGLQGLFGGVGDDVYRETTSDDFSQVNYDGVRAEYNISQNASGIITVDHPIWGTDTLIGIDALIFTGREPGVDGEVTGEFEFLNTSDIVFDAPLPIPTPLIDGLNSLGFNVVNPVVQLREAGDFGGTFSGGTAIEIDGGIVTGTINSFRDVDRFSVDVEAGQTLRIGLFADDFGAQGADAPGTLTVRNSDGDILAQGLDTRDGLLTINETFTESGTVFIDLTNTGATEPTPYNLIVENFVDDIANDSSTSATLELGGAASVGNLQSFGDRDVFALDVEAGQNIDVTLARESLTGLTSFRIIDEDGNVIIDESDINLSGPSLNPLESQTFNFTAETSGQVFVEVTSTIFRATETQGLGEFSLTAELVSNTGAADDIAGDTSTDAVLEVGGSVTSDLFGEGDTDFFAITIEAGQTIQFSQSNLNIPDQGREVTLRDSDGNIVASGPTAFGLGNITNDPFAFQAEETGTFFLSIESTDDFASANPGTNFGEGDYTISATEIADDFGNFVSNATLLEAGNTAVNGNLEYLGDADVFTIFLNAGDTINIDVDTNVFTDRTLIDPDGNVIVGGPGQISFDGGFTVTESGLYAVSIEASFDPSTDPRGSFDETGEYSLQVNVETNDAPGDGSITGTNGDDFLEGTDGDDEIFGLDGDDRIDGNNGDDFIFGGAGNDELSGGNGNDTLNGGAGTDVFFGLDGEDNIVGGAGNDFIEGGEGNDFLVGGSGADEFIFLAGDGHDVIADFEIGTDSISIFLGGFDEFVSTGSDFSDFEEILFQDGNDALIAINANQSIRLLDTQVDDLLGNNDFNTITGTSAAETLVGTDGDDEIFAEGGNDSVFGGAGDDIIDSGAGNDYLVGQGGADVFVFNAGDGHDTIADFGPGEDALEIFGERIDFSNFSDIADSLSQDGDDVLISINANQSIRLVDTQLSALIPDEDVITITGTSEGETIVGTFDDDFIFAAGGNDTVFAGLGNDVIDSGTGNDYLVGGDGADVFVFNVGDGHDTIADFEIGVDAVEIFGTRIDSFADIESQLSQDGADVLISINANQSIRLVNTDLESLILGNPAAVTGRAQADALFGTWGDDRVAGEGGSDFIFGHEGDDTLQGGGGGDSIFGGNGNDEISGGLGADIINGGNGADILTGGAGADVINGDDGADTIFGGGAADIINGGNGADEIFGSLGADIIDGGNGGDTLNGGAGADVISGGDGADTIIGGGAADTIDGGEGADEIIGGTGADHINGGNGGDFINGGGGADIIEGGAGNDEIFGGGAGDTLNGGDGADLIFGGAGADSIFGGNGADSLNGGSNADVLNGGAGNDSLNGGGGADILNGGSGNDFLFGGAGDDVFVFESESGFNRIADFQSGQDVVDLSDFNFEGFEDLLLVQGENGNVFIFIDEDTSIEFTDIFDIHDLSPDDFVF